ncbi:MAG TPA: ankyrin repeat domain-containing protein, partial [Vicinamibacteria bacterium]|nr:ankyrin repeat domain-containing protein [Vicinamibacteria bacterium]
LHYAAEHGNHDVIVLLDQRGADLDLRDPQGWTPLHVAVDADIDSAHQAGHTTTLPTARTMIEAGAREDIQADDGATARDVSAAYGQEALDLYDKVSRVTWVDEPTIAAFASTCQAVLERAGYSVRVLGDQHQLSIAENDADHDRVWYRFFLSAGHLYAQRRQAGFADSLTGRVRQGFDRLRWQRGR